MVKNALQAQLLKAGLVDDKKAKQLNKQTQHAKRTGEEVNAEVRQAIELAKAKKLEQDQKLNQEKQLELEQKTRHANIIQMIKQHQLKDTSGETVYQFIDQAKIKKIYLAKKLYEQIVAGQVAIARLDTGYALLPRPLADRIEQKMHGFIVVANDKPADQLAADDPYAAYVIPDDLMW